MTIRPAEDEVADDPLGDDVDRPGRGDDLAPAPARILDHGPFFPAGQLLGPVAGVERADGLRGLEERRVVPVDDDLGDERGHVLVDGETAELVDDGPLEEIPHAPLGHGVADVEAVGRNPGHGLLLLEEEVPHLGAVAVDDDELVALADDVDHEFGRLAGVPLLLLLETPFGVREQGVAAEGDERDPLGHGPNFLRPQNSRRMSLSLGEPISSSS